MIGYFDMAVADQDLAALTLVPGVGKRTAAGRRRAPPMSSAKPTTALQANSGNSLIIRLQSESP